MFTFCAICAICVRYFSKGPLFSAEEPPFFAEEPPFFAKEPLFSAEEAPSYTTYTPSYTTFLPEYQPTTFKCRQCRMILKILFRNQL